jgi:hypothetical protein
MTAGRELDALIAERVMGIPVEMFDGEPTAMFRPGYDYELGPVKHYSTDIAAAFDVVEKVGRTWRGFDFMLYWELIHAPGQWRAGWFEWSYDVPEGRASAYADQVPLAICLAALETVEGSPP